MIKVLVFSVLLLLGLVGSQWLPGAFGASYAAAGDVVRIMTMFALAFIMIRVGNEFHIDKSNLKQYGWDYFVAFTAASFPWVFVTLYFVFVLLPPEVWSNAGAWKETLLAGRFAAPTSAGILFSMLAAAGMAGTWLFRKARILAIFDDLDTVLLMIPLKMLMVGLVWQLGITVFVMFSMVAIAYIFLHRVRIPVTWQWVCVYSAVIAGISEVVYKGSLFIDDSVPIHIEVLLPAFVLGCIMANPLQEAQYEKRVENSENLLHHIIEKPMERRASSIIAAIFMVLVGLSMPLIFPGEGGLKEPYESSLHAGGVPDAEAAAAAIGSADNIGTVTAAQPPLPWQSIFIHVLLVTLLSNAGKMFPLLCYRREAHWRERLALSIGMWPRGEVGAGVLVISLSYGIGGPIVTIAMLSLATNLLLTGLFIFFIKKLISEGEVRSSMASGAISRG
jgi:Kef-type K+ transport system membrane component KefB